MVRISPLTKSSKMLSLRSDGQAGYWRIEDIRDTYIANPQLINDGTYVVQGWVFGEFGECKKNCCIKLIFPRQKKKIGLDIYLRDNFVWFENYEVT